MSSIYDDFLTDLTIDKIKALSARLNEHAQDGHVNQKTYFEIASEIFHPLEQKKETYSSILEQLFNRFKDIKCEMFNKGDKYYITKIITEDSIKVYELCCALSVFMKYKFKQKVKLIFELTDSDDDDLLNEGEIKKIIQTLNFMFSNEESPILTNSTVLNQSLSNIIVKQSINSLLNYPGLLGVTLKKDHYVSFDAFYNALCRIQGYKFKIIPCFISLNHCLNTVKTESKLSVNPKVKEDFLKVSSEIIEPLSPKKKNKFLGHLKNSIGQNFNKSHPWKCMMVSAIKDQIGNNKKIDGEFSSLIPGMKGKLKPLKINSSSEQIFKISYSKLVNLEAQPALFDFPQPSNKGNISTLIKKPSLSNTTQHLNSTKAVTFNQKKFIGLGLGSQWGLWNKRVSWSTPHNRYMTVDEVMNELNAISNKHKIEANDEILVKLGDRCTNNMLRMKNYLRRKDNSDWWWGDLKYKYTTLK